MTSTRPSATARGAHGAAGADEAAGPMSDAEALMWRLEKDPHLASTFGTLSLLDRPAEFAALQQRMIAAAENVPRLGWRVVQPVGELGRPTWADDPDFDIDYHVRRVALPKPGSLQQLRELASQFVLDPLDRTRPLWQFLLVDGVRGGKGALVQKMHHTITDGENGVRMSLEFLDFERDAKRPAPSRVESATTSPCEPPPPLTSWDAVRSVLEASWRLPIGIARQVGELLADPASIPAATSAAATSLRSIAQQLGETDRARSPLWTERSLRRTLETVQAPLAATKDAADRLGGTLNTAFMTIAAEASARYHLERDAPVDHLRASMAVSTRSGDSGANAFALVRLLVPTAEMPIGERFVEIAELTTAARDEGRSGASLETLAVVTSALPTSLLTRLARQQAHSVDFATSNVRASPVPVYIAGAELLENYAIGPLAGVAWNLTMLSYHGSLDMGINIDTAAVDDPARLATLIGQAARRLASAR